MILTSKNLETVKFKTKRYSLEKADAEVIVRLIPTSMITDSKDALENGQEQSFGMTLIKYCVVDENGDPIFKTEESFESLPLAVKKEILDVIYDYNGLSDVSQKEVKKN